MGAGPLAEAFGGRPGSKESVDQAFAAGHHVVVYPGGDIDAAKAWLFGITDGQRLARLLRLPQLLRVKAVPISVSIPWGLSVGIAGMLPYLPLPTKLATAVLPAMRAAPGESAEEFALVVEQAMQRRLDDLVAHRTPIIG